MRLAGLLLLSIFLTAVSSAQDTNFAVGPQYLVTTSSSFLRPIATPSMSLEPAPANTSAATGAEAIPEPQWVGAQMHEDLARVYWGDDWVRSVKGEAPATVSEIEITSPQTTPPLPASFVEVGVIHITNVQSLHASGYGLTLGEVSSYWKARHHQPRMYTNADIARLHGS
jgi:hypothetical protein